jgi:hypothetical protein
MSGTPENTDHRVKPEPLDDEEATANLADDGSLGFGSTATGDPSSQKQTVDEPEVEPSESRPGKLVEGNRVAVAEDME